MTQREQDENLIVVATVEGYSLKHDLPSIETIKLFKQFNILPLLRSEYEVLHTQEFEESISFVEDVLARKSS